MSLAAFTAISVSCCERNTAAGDRFFVEDRRLEPAPPDGAALQLRLDYPPQVSKYPDSHCVMTGEALEHASVCVPETANVTLWGTFAETTNASEVAPGARRMIVRTPSRMMSCVVPFVVRLPKYIFPVLFLWQLGVGNTKSIVTVPARYAPRTTSSYLSNPGPITAFAVIFPFPTVN